MLIFGGVTRHVCEKVTSERDPLIHDVPNIINHSDSEIETRNFSVFEGTFVSLFLQTIPSSSSSLYIFISPQTGSDSELNL